MAEPRIEETMMKVMFIEPSFPEVPTADVVFPFNYACLGAVLQRAGHQVEYVFPAANHLSTQDVVNQLSKTDSKLIGIGGLLPYLPAIIKFVELAKAARPDIPIVLGGPMVTYMPELVLKKTSADFCVAGEGEIALLKFVNSLEKGEDYSNIPGLVFRRDGQIINNGMGEVMPFEEIPMPNWNDFPMEYYMYSDWYLPKWSRKKKESVVAWLVSRGCPMKCNFCASGCEPRYKTVEQAMAELREIVERFDPDYVMFVDNFLTPNRKYTTEFCEALIANRFHFKFSITARVNIVNPELLALLKKAGCQMIFYGLECANNEILKFMKKGITVEQATKAIEMTKKAGIYPMVSIMFGQPGETFDDFFNSLRIALMTTDPADPAPNIASVMPVLTFPGTGIYQYAKEHGYFTDDEDYWSKYGGDFRIRYIDYWDEAIGIAYAMYRWKYHQSMADHLVKSLLRQKSPYFNLQYSVARFLKAHPRITKILAPLLGPQRLYTLDHMQEVSPNQERARKEQARQFVDRCLTELVGLRKRKNLRTQEWTE
ncbi:B12-binding domain-containing radical SAM protein [Chloroflexota bacterium]